MKISIILILLAASGLDIPNIILTPLPLCKHHHFVAKNKQFKPQTHCPMCNTSIRNLPVRACPNSEVINKYLLEHTGFEGTISSNNKVCFSCYKCQLEILKDNDLFSSDTHLSQLITSMNNQPKSVKCINDVSTKLVYL